MDGCLKNQTLASRHIELLPAPKGSPEIWAPASQTRWPRDWAILARPAQNPSSASKYFMTLWPDTAACRECTS